MGRTVANSQTPPQGNEPHKGEGLVLAGLVQNLLVLAERFGLSRDNLINWTGFKPEDLADPNRLVPLRYLESILLAGIEHTGDDLLGLHLSETARPESFGVAGYILQACSTLRELIEMCIRYEHLVSTVGKTSMEFKPGVVAWTWDLAMVNPEFRRHAVDYMLGSLASIRGSLADKEPWRFDCVLIQHSAPKTDVQRNEYERIFGCPVQFDQPVNALVFPVTRLDTPLRHSNIAMRDALESHARFLEQKQTTSGFLANARSILRVMVMQGKPSREELANALGMSSRHLLRRLSVEGVTYRALLDEVRREMASKLLLESDDSVEEIAYRLQYSESQSFIRWFKAWQGVTPSQFRQEAANRFNNER